METYHSLSQIQQEIKQGKTTCVNITKGYLNRIQNNTHLNAFLEVFQESALAQATLVDEKIALGKAGKLAGMVLGIKDNICYKGHKVSAGSKILEGFESLYNATVIERLLKEDVIIIGRLNCDEFAMGSSNENSAFGPVKNPLNINTVPGGSSGGSAAAVAADLCLVALGSDTGGSIRQPASFCGVVGLKPTYGRVSRYGLIAYASSFDQIGPLTKNVDDAALILKIIAGQDEYDSTLSSHPVPDFCGITPAGEKFKIAYLAECIESSGLDPEIKDRMIHLIEQLKAQGHQVEAVNFPYLDYLVPVYYILTTAEASSNLSRFDGVHYGYRSPNATDLESNYKKTRSEGFGKEVKRRIMLGTFVLSAGYYDAYYSKAQKARMIIKNKTKEILAQYDFILMPSTPGTAFEFGKKSKDPITMYLEDVFTVQANLAGLPAISLPLGQHTSGLPFGIQLMGDSFQEEKLLSFSKNLMQNFLEK
ncbi:MAG: Asp-tRNA(Asn)/Glu-tRNA(Gln) amidotransferase subunit GatA [Bacteroidetes bacterium]|nr:Asp-tRNA(Asn)/Glu-tRNA(Gln) amidotransferase subunit GatA [Bacteroidota bacterium]HET6245396.1 Asp-tRNA(Asn)/Glu-tRNA(Gln) amidotransferase subunit GatA [Bacteroidia bacterium]